MTCPFKRCADEVTHCNGACHGIAPDGSPLLELPELRDSVAKTEVTNAVKLNRAAAGLIEETS